MKEDGPARGSTKRCTSQFQTLRTSWTFIKRLIRAFRDTDWDQGGWLGVFKNNLPEDLEVVLKTSLLELKGEEVRLEASGGRVGDAAQGG